MYLSTLQASAPVRLAPGAGVKLRAGEGTSSPLRTLVQAELLRLQGELTLASGGAQEEARLAFEEALTIAGECGARSLALRAAVRLAHLDAELGERRAQDPLASIYGRFSGDFEAQT